MPYYFIQVSLSQNALNREKDLVDTAFANPARLGYQRPRSVSMPFFRALLLILMVNNVCVAHLYAQSLQPAIEFINVTAAAGIKFVHFKGNNGISINREEFGPGVCVAAFPPAMPCTEIMETAHSPMSPKKPAFQGPATD